MLAGFVAVDILDALNIVQFAAFRLCDDDVSVERYVVKHGRHLIGAANARDLILSDDVTNRG